MIAARTKLSSSSLSHFSVKAMPKRMLVTLADVASNRRAAPKRLSERYASIEAVADRSIADKTTSTRRNRLVLPEPFGPTTTRVVFGRSSRISVSNERISWASTLFKRMVRISTSSLRHSFHFVGGSLGMFSSELPVRNLRNHGRIIGIRARSGSMPINAASILRLDHPTYL